MPWFDAVSCSRAKAAFEDCWGHLRPKTGVYPGWIEISYSAWGDCTLHACHFDGVECNPYTHDAMCNFVFNYDVDEVGVYRWTGNYKRGEQEVPCYPDDSDCNDTETCYFHRFEDGEWTKVY